MNDYFLNDTSSFCGMGAMHAEHSGVYDFEDVLEVDFFKEQILDVWSFDEDGQYLLQINVLFLGTFCRRAKIFLQTP